MPATARRSKSEAYEEGIREGQEMAKRSRGEKPTEEEELDTECGCAKKKGRKCDGGCGYKPKRSDSLTPQEYLTACEMGIQGRSSIYIRARLDVVEARNDLKCGKGAISEGEKCTKGPATKVEPKKPTGKKRPAKAPDRKGPTKTQVAYIAGYAALSAVSLYQLKNIRQAYSEKFDPAQRYKPLEKPIGNPSEVLSKFVQSDKQAAPSLFGEVRFGKYENKDVVVKSFGKKGVMGKAQIDLMRNQGVISKDTADALVRGQKALQVNEAQGASLAGQHGIGPKVIAAGTGVQRTFGLGAVEENTLVTEVARGRPLSSQSALMREGPKLQAQLQRDPVAAVKKIAALQWRGFTKGTEISAVNKDRIINTMGRMHTLGMSHNDLHPGNVFISKDGAQFIDFGTSDRGGASVASEFVRLMNPPRAGLQQSGGMGYNLRTADPEGYRAAESRIRSVIGKRSGKLTSVDIQRAFKRSQNKEKFEADLQVAVDDFYKQYGKRSRTDAKAVALSPAKRRIEARTDLKCGKGAISEGEKCTKGPAQKVEPKKAAVNKEFRAIRTVAQQKKRETVPNDRMYKQLREIEKEIDTHAEKRSAKQKGSTKGALNKVKAGLEVAATLGGAAAYGVGMYQVGVGGVTGNYGMISRGARTGQLGVASINLANASKASRTGNKKLSHKFLKLAGRQAAIGVGQEVALGAYAGYRRAGGAQGLRNSVRSTYQAAQRRKAGVRSTPHGTGWASSAYDRPLPGSRRKRDSVYAKGFTPDAEQLAI